MTKTLTITAIITATILVVGSLYIGSTVLAPVEATSDVSPPPMDPPMDPPTKVNTICPQENVQHWDKIIFEPKLKGTETKILIPADPSSELVIKTRHDIKILDDPETVVNLGRAVAQKLNELGYRVEKDIGPDKTTTVSVSETNIKIKDVEYAIACISNAVPPAIPNVENTITHVVLNTAKEDFRLT